MTFTLSWFELNAMETETFKKIPPNWLKNILMILFELIEVTRYGRINKVLT